MKHHETDVLVIGSGIAGLVLAKLLAPHGRVTVVTKKEDSESNTNYAQGGIAAVLDPNDTFESHIDDTMEAGGNLCRRKAVEILVREGPELVRRLVDWGARFCQGDDGASFEMGREGGHSRRRIIHAHDLTGREVERALLASLAEEPNAVILEHQLAVWLVAGARDRDTYCHGAVVFDESKGELLRYAARATVLCSGGLGRVYLHTTNPPIATGDGVAMAYRIGARVANLEFIQFHPTVFYSANKPHTFLISEAVRGEGALLRRLDGSTFMEEYDERGCLAPRDIVARAIDREMKQSGDPFVYLDMRSLGADFIKQRFPFITASCRGQGVDPATEMVPVVPAAHYCCGGIETDLDAQTNIVGLYATGEVSCTGVHGANRLASNSLLEALVWSRRAAQHIQARLESLPLVSDAPLRHAFDPGRQLEGVRVSHCRQEVARIMWDYVGIVRSDERLRLAHRRIEIIKREVEEYVGQGYFSPDLIELWNVVQVAELIVRSAMLRKESRGLHYNVDHPDGDDVNWLQDTVLKKRVTPEMLAG